MKRLKRWLMATPLVVGLGAAGIAQAGSLATITRPVCGTANCTIEGAVGRVKIQKNGRIWSRAVVVQGCAKYPAVRGFGVDAFKAVPIQQRIDLGVCLGVGRSWRGVDGTVESTEFSHRWSFTRPKGCSTTIHVENNSPMTAWDDTRCAGTKPTRGTPGGDTCGGYC